MPVIQTPPDRHVTCPEKNATETWTSRLRTVEEDPFFFDHPLDHLPALLLADGVTELVEHIATTTSATAAGPRPAWRAQTLELEFGSFAEKGLPVELSARALPGTPGGWQVGGRQQGRSVCEGRVSAAPVPPPDTPVLPTPQAAEEDLDCQCAMVAPELVHRHRPENVLLADYRNHGGGYSAELLSPPRGHHLRGAEGRDTELRSLIELVEGARQFVTLLGHEARQVAFDRRYVVASMRAVTTRAIRRAEPVRLWADTLPSVHGGDVHIRFSSGGGAVGEACFSGYAFSPAAYRRLRGASGGEAR